MIKYFVITNFRGTRSSVGMLKGCMVRERLGTPVLDIACSCVFVLLSTWPKRDCSDWH